MIPRIGGFLARYGHQISVESGKSCCTLLDRAGGAAAIRFLEAQGDRPQLVSPPMVSALHHRLENCNIYAIYQEKA